MIKSNNELSKNYDLLPILAYIVYKDFELSQLIPISVLKRSF